MRSRIHHGLPWPSVERQLQLRRQKYHGHTALSLTGNVGVDGAETKIHAHVTLGRRDGSAIGGHVLAATVFPTLEMHLVDYDEAVVRGKDDETGLSLIKRVD